MDNPFRGRLNAAGLDLIDGLMHRVYGPRKERLFDGDPSRVVEIGPGVGANFRYYAAGTQVVGIEPSPGMHGRLRRRARSRDLDLDLVAAHAEELPLETGSEEWVVGTLVLCTVGSPEAALSEIVRILRPGGRFVFIEHVAAAPHSALGAVQRGLRRPWRWMFEGCTLDRRTLQRIEAAGFREVRAERFTVGGGLLPVSPHVGGIAVR
ncbi:MAG: class I SAM-dependent methyltransferase [Gemmatimonadota bacterium]|nr:class I SAM-dependent methyltransferase [Gemmatimonadota bacterium]